MDSDSDRVLALGATDSPGVTDSKVLSPILSIVVPAHNEQANIGRCIDELLELLIDTHNIDVELIIINDNSSDATEAEVLLRRQRWPCVRLIRRTGPSGFGRAIRTGLEFVRGEVIIIYMGDRSDHPQDALLYYQTICNGFDCVYGSRFIKGSVVQRYPKVKLVVNRMVNTLVQWMFWTELNDLTNAFKAYRRNIIHHCGPYRACHFNITLEMSLSALIAGFKIAQVPIHWEGRTWGSSKLRMREMGRRYLCTLLILFLQRILTNDDAKAEGKRDMVSGVEVSDVEPEIESFISKRRS